MVRGRKTESDIGGDKEKTYTQGSKFEVRDDVYFIKGTPSLSLHR